MTRFTVIVNDGVIKVEIDDDGNATLEVFGIRDVEPLVQAINRAHRAGAKRGDSAIWTAVRGLVSPGMNFRALQNEASMSDRFERLAKLAVHLDKLIVDPSARVGYDLFAGGLIWSDERPGVDVVEFEVFCAIRRLLRFRSSLIVGVPYERFRGEWDFAQKSCPNWPGFLAERRDSKWHSLYEELDAKGVASWEGLDERYRAQQQRRATQGIESPVAGMHPAPPEAV